MPQTNQNKVGILSSNTYGYKYSSAYPAGNRPAANYPLLFKDDFSAGTVGDSYAGFFPTTVYANDHPHLTGKALKVNIGTMQPPTCGGSMNYGGRKVLPSDVPFGSKIWYSVKLFHPVTQTWGYCYDPGDSAEATGCGKQSDGNEWTKFMVLSPSSGTARVYVQPRAFRRNVNQQPAVRLYSEHSQAPNDNPTATFPLGRWYTLQIECFLSDTGYMRVWVDNTVICYANAAPVSTGNSIHEWGIGDYWNGAPYTDGAANRSHFWMKDVMIATDAPGFSAPTDSDGNGNVFIAPWRRPIDFT